MSATMRSSLGVRRSRTRAPTWSSADSALAAAPESDWIQLWPLPTLRTHSVSAVPVTLRRSEEHTSELQSHSDLVCRLLLEKKKLTYTGMIGAALAVTLHRGGLLLVVLVLPLSIPVLIFVVAASQAAISGTLSCGKTFSILC